MNLVFIWIFLKCHKTEYLVGLTGFLRILSVYFDVGFVILEIFNKFCFSHHTQCLSNEQKIRYPCKVFSFVTHGNLFQE